MIGDRLRDGGRVGMAELTECPVSMEHLEIFKKIKDNPRSIESVDVSSLGDEEMKAWAYAYRIAIAPYVWRHISDQPGFALPKERRRLAPPFWLSFQREGYDYLDSAYKHYIRGIADNLDNKPDSEWGEQEWLLHSSASVREESVRRYGKEDSRESILINSGASFADYVPFASRLARLLEDAYKKLTGEIISQEELLKCLKEERNIRLLKDLLKNQIKVNLV